VVCTERMKWLLQRAYLILTDSRGIHAEAPSLGKPVLGMRGATERPEGVEGSTVRLVGADTGTIVHGAEHLLLESAEYLQMARSHIPYGVGGRRHLKSSKSYKRFSQRTAAEDFLALHQIYWNGP